MTAAEQLRALVKEATPGPWQASYWPLPEPTHHVTRVNPDVFSSMSLGSVTGPCATEADARLIALAPQLAELVADMAQDLERIASGELARPHEDVAAAALARLDALFSEEDSR